MDKFLIKTKRSVMSDSFNGDSQCAIPSITILINEEDRDAERPEPGEPSSLSPTPEPSPEAVNAAITNKFNSKMPKNMENILHESSDLNSYSDSDSDTGSSDSEIVHKQKQVIPGQKKTFYKQKFRLEWRNQFGKWLSTDKTGQPICRVCAKSVKGGISHIKRHEGTKLHQSNIMKLKDTPKINLLLKDDKRKILSKQIQNAELKLIMFLHEHNLPFLLMEHLPKVVSSICPDSKIASGLKCSRTKATQLTKEILAPRAMTVLKEKIGKNVYSLIIDETTDVATKKSLAIVIRFYDGDDIKDRFLGLVRVTSGTAESLFDAISNHLRTMGIPFENIIGLAADNASVMMGNIKGVQARFKEKVPNIYVMGCVCHSFHLCASAAANKLPKSIEDFARNIYNHFSNSSKRLEQLHDCQVFVNLKPHKLLRPSQTRWLSLQACVDRILESWDALNLYFTNTVFLDNLHSTEITLTNLQNPIYKIYFSFLSYILDIVNKLNLEFQSESPKLHLLLTRVTALVRTILRNYMDKKYLDRTAIDSVSSNDPRFFLSLDNMYFGAQVEILLEKGNVDPQEVKNFKLRALEFYIELCTQIKARFKFNDPILNFVSNFSPKNAVSGEINSIAKDSLKYFPQLVKNLENLNIEWRLLADIEELTKYSDESFMNFWQKVFLLKNELNDEMFPNLSHLVKGLICLPHSSAAAERVFSQLNLLKTKTRNRLEIDTCDSILHCKDLLGKQNCFNWEPN